MKKIVALVLAMVMVLGLATTAFGATTTKYQKLYSKDANDVTATASDVEITVYPAKAVKYDKTTGFVDTVGNVEYVKITGDTNTYVFVNSLGEADVVLYKDAAMKQAKFYLDEVDSADYVEGVAFANFGEKCGQVDYADYDATVKYYTVKGDDVFTVYAEDKDSPAFFVMVGGKLVGVDYATGLVDLVAHTPVYEVKDGKVLSIECGVCGLKAVEAPNALSVPKGIVAFDGNWYWPVAAAPAEDTTVESPKTFDAGIAMYVGMSVMAAAGSAVVLKKKD